jgi:predicted anti-sigma-YlaC factor YlaD
MDCQTCRTALSSRLDGEPPAVPDAGVDAHLAQCASCRAFATDAERLHRVVRIARAPAVPDLTPSIVAAIADDARSGAPHRVRPARRIRDWRWLAAPGQEQALRVLLVAIAVVQIGVALPALLLGSDAGLPVHTARHLGSFDVALAVGFLFAAWKPARIPGILPVVAALVVCLLGTSLLDVISGTTGASSETHHATDFAGLVVVWLLSRTATIAPPGGTDPGREAQLA